MHSSMERGRQWTICAARVREGALHHLYNSDSDSDSDIDSDNNMGDIPINNLSNHSDRDKRGTGTGADSNTGSSSESDDEEDDEGFGVDHTPPFGSKAHMSFMRSNSLNRGLFISEPSDVSSCGCEIGLEGQEADLCTFSPGRIAAARPYGRSTFGSFHSASSVTTPPSLRVSDTSTSTSTSGPEIVTGANDLSSEAVMRTALEQAPETGSSLGVVLGPTSTPVRSSSARELPGNAEVAGPSHASAKAFSDVYESQPAGCSALQASPDSSRSVSDGLHSTSCPTACATPTQPSPAEPTESVRLGSSSTPEMLPILESGKREIRIHVQERDVVIASVAVMVGMYIPEGCRGLCFFACLLAATSALKKLASTKTLKDVVLGTVDMDRRSASARQLLGGDTGGSAAGGEALARKSFSTVGNVLGANGVTMLAAVGRRLSGSFKFKCLTRERTDASVETVGFTDSSVAGGEDDARSLGMLDGDPHGHVQQREEMEQEGEGAADDDPHEVVLASLTENHRAFVASSGKEQQYILVQQCLAYANGDIEQARKVLGKFSKFRTAEEWGMVLDAAEVEAPLRSKVHTLTESRDSAGRGMLMFLPAKMDMTKCSAASYQKMLCYVLQEALKDEALQTTGLVLLVDARDVGFGLLRHFHLADYRRGLGMLSGAFPAKLKAIRILHPTRALRVALSIALPLLSAKMRARVEVVSSESARDGTFAKDLADVCSVPVELGIGGTWKGLSMFWSRWIDERVV